MVSDQLLRKWELVRSLSGDCSSRLRGHFHADATFSVSTLNYRISMRRGNINVGGPHRTPLPDLRVRGILTVKGIVFRSSLTMERDPAAARDDDENGGSTLAGATVFCTPAE